MDLPFYASQDQLHIGRGGEGGREGGREGTHHTVMVMIDLPLQARQDQLHIRRRGVTPRLAVRLMVQFGGREESARGIGNGHGAPGLSFFGR